MVHRKTLLNDNGNNVNARNCLYCYTVCMMIISVYVTDHRKVGDAFRICVDGGNIHQYYTM
jgi:hypothetical protein